MAMPIASGNEASLRTIGHDQAVLVEERVPLVSATHD